MRAVSFSAGTEVPAEAAALRVEATSRALRLPTMREQAGPLAEAALRDRLTHLTEMLLAELEDRDARRRARRIAEARTALAPKSSRYCSAISLLPSRSGFTSVSTIRIGLLMSVRSPSCAACHIGDCVPCSGVSTVPVGVDEGFRLDPLLPVKPQPVGDDW